ncbi:MAG TPA: cbb3-type cytochrome c oxidase subunit 3 [Myxococcota bacterium]|jgi:cbb3-type cytochrome oxidase subunit 3
MDWIALYKFGRLALLALTLLGITVWAYSGKRRERLELPAQRMLEDDEA